MFIGHYGAAFAGKRLAPRLSLGTLFLSVQWADLLWPILLLAGVEHVRGVPGLMPTNPYDFYDYPISHSLLGLCLWGVLFGGLHFVRRRDAVAAAVLAAGVVSHWFLDVLMHRPDLPLLPEGPYAGFGLWRSVPWTVAVEGLIYVGGLILYLRRTRASDGVGTWALWSLVLLLPAGWAFSLGKVDPLDPTKLAWGALCAWIVVPWGYWIDRHRVGLP